MTEDYVDIIIIALSGSDPTNSTMCVSSHHWELWCPVYHVMLHVRYTYLESDFFLRERGGGGRERG